MAAIVLTSERTSPHSPLRQDACNACGATDKKLNECGRCHIEKYCDRTCQKAAWPTHKRTCLLLSQKERLSSSTEKMQDLALWSGKKFGELRGYRVLDEDVRILSHTGGFVVFLPEQFWRELDCQVPLLFPKDKNAQCWIAGKGFAFVKFDTDPSKLKGSDKDLISKDLDTVLNKIERFSRQNFFENKQAYPENSDFTHGSFKDSPDLLRPCRIRLNGDFRYQL